MKNMKLLVTLPLLLVVLWLGFGSPLHAVNGVLTGLDFEAACSEGRDRASVNNAKLQNAELRKFALGYGRR